MAEQSNLTIGGVGASGYRTPISKKWGETYADGQKIYATLLADGLGITSTAVDGTQYSQVLSIKGSKALTGAILDIVASGDAGVTTTWQWYNSAGRSFDGGLAGDSSELGGEWADVASPAVDFSAVLDAGNNAEWAIMQQASKWRVKVVCLSAADVKGTLNAANSAKFWVNDDHTAELNAAGTISSLTGADPS